jgi:hypothetical protein
MPETSLRRKTKTPTTVTNNSQHPTHLHVDETTLMFSSNAVFAYPCDDGNGGDNIQHEGQDFKDHDEETNCERYELKIDYVAMDQVCTWSHY